MPLSGPAWVPLFPASSRTNDLTEPFRGNVNRFLAALRAAGARIDIAETLRPPARVYLMHYSFRIAREGLDAGTVPAQDGVDIEWVHRDPQGTPDVPASKAAAEQMVQGYEIVFRPSLTSHHCQGTAIDMTISWQGDLRIANAQGAQILINSGARNGGNAQLQQVGAGYGVRKLASDPPHWSIDGH
jgi:hypothetical protein